LLICAFAAWYFLVGDRCVLVICAGWSYMYLLVGHIYWLVIFTGWSYLLVGHIYWLEIFAVWPNCTSCDITHRYTYVCFSKVAKSIISWNKWNLS
jgi:hypothetical protein